MKGQSTKSRVLSLNKQILRLYERIDKIQKKCPHSNMIEQEFCGIKNLKCPDCGYVDLLIARDFSYV